jgi:alpha-beta hydrolase superfamily lysophospholipase
MGSFLLRRYLSSRGKGLSGAIIMGTGFTPPRMSAFGIGLTRLLSKTYGWYHRSTLLTKIALGSNKRFDMTGQHPENSWLTKDAEIAAWYYQQPACTFTFTLNGYLALFDTVEYCCLQENADRIPKDLPILLVSGADDGVGNYGKGVEEVYTSLIAEGVTDVTRKIYPAMRHEILNESDRKIVYEDILSFISSQIS